MFELKNSNMLTNLIYRTQVLHFKATVKGKDCRHRFQGVGELRGQWNWPEEVEMQASKPF